MQIIQNNITESNNVFRSAKSFPWILLLNLSIAIIVGTDAAVIKTERQSTKKPWELTEALRATSEIYGFNGTWITDQEFYYKASDRSVRKYNVATDKDDVLVYAKFLELYPGSSSFTLSPDNKKLLVSFDEESIFPHSSIAKYDIYDIEKNERVAIHDGEYLQYCAWSPIDDRLSYVYKNNVFLHFENNQELQMTFDGITSIIFNGVPDWVYEEEVLNQGSAMWWSPDGTKLASGYFNDEKVDTFKYFLYGEAEMLENQYPEEVAFKYPKSGRPNPTVALRIFDLSQAGTPTQVEIKAPINIVTEDHILQNVIWANNEQVLITWLNRRQNIGTMQQCNAKGDCKEVLRLQEPDGWIQMGRPTCLKPQQNCLFIYWVDNWYKVWNLNLQTGQNSWATRLNGDFTVLNVYGYDESNDKLYYQATLKDDPTVYQVYANDECLTCNLRDVDGELCRSALASFSKSFSYYAITCNGPNPSYTKIYETKTHNELKVWEPNTAFRQKLATKLRPTIKYLNVTLADGQTAAVKLQLPPNLDETKKYPMIVNVYAAPNSVLVTNDFDVGFDAYMTTNRQVIYAAIDGRGTGNKGKHLLFSVNNNLGKLEVEDQIFVTKYLQKHLAYVDRERTGIWGSSYGGYMTVKTLEADEERVFKCGISVAPVTSWRYYDTIYTERYMGLPTTNGNHYNESSVFNKLDSFREHDFLLIHGSADDNVHYQQSLLFSKELQRNGIYFKQMIYPDENHSFGSVRPHLYNTTDHFWTNCLNLDVDDDEQLPKLSYPYIMLLILCVCILCLWSVCLWSVCLWHKEVCQTSAIVRQLFSSSRSWRLSDVTAQSFQTPIPLNYFTPLLSDQS